MLQFCFVHTYQIYVAIRLAITPKNIFHEFFIKPWASLDFAERLCCVLIGVVVSLSFALFRCCKKSKPG